MTSLLPSHTTHTGSKRHRTDQNGLPQGVIIVKQEGEDIAPIEKFFEERALIGNTRSHTYDDQIPQINPCIRWVGRPIEERLHKREISICDYFDQDKHSLCPQSCLNDGSRKQNWYMNRRNDDGENDETIAQTPYFSLGYLRVSHGTTHRTTLKRNRALWRTFIQKVNTARITVRRRIFTVTLPETRIRPCDHCDCGCDTPPEWDRSSGTEQLFRQKQAVPATWTK